MINKLENTKVQWYKDTKSLQRTMIHDLNIPIPKSVRLSKNNKMKERYNIGEKGRIAHYLAETVYYPGAFKVEEVEV